MAFNLQRQGGEACCVWLYQMEHETDNDCIAVTCTVSVLSSSCPHSAILPHCKQDVWLTWVIL